MNQNICIMGKSICANFSIYLVLQRGSLSFKNNIHIKFILLLSLFYLVTTVQSQISSAGFLNSICPEPLSINYTYENYSFGSHGHGYRIYRNGIVILDKYEMFGPLEVKEMIFINDSTGFISEFNESNNAVYKTSNYGESWVDIGYGAMIYLDLFIVNAHTGYLLTTDFVYQDICVTRVSDFEYKWILSSNPSINDTILYDTVFGNPLCNDYSLAFELENGTETVTYQINYFVNPIVNVSYYQELQFLNIYPNPVRDNLIIRYDRSFGEKIVFTIYDYLGKKVQSFQSTNLEMQIFDVHKLVSGLYILSIEANDSKQIKKFIKK